MSNYVLSCCSTVDLSKEHLDSIAVNYICFHYAIDGVEYLDDLGQSMSHDEFYKKMTEGADTRTSQINVSEYLEYFESFLSRGEDVLHISLSSGISGSYNSARNAAAIASERHPERKIYVVDSLAASSGFGLLIDTLAQKKAEGMNIDELRAWTEENKLKLHHWFFSSDLTFYVKGGRISKAAGLFGGLLGICPLLNVDNLGRLIPRAKIRSKKRVMDEIVARMEEHAEDSLSYNGKCYMCQSACYDDAKVIAEMIETRFPNLNGKVLINNIGTTIGSHTGPGTVALFFWGDERKD